MMSLMVTDLRLMRLVMKEPCPGCGIFAAFALLLTDPMRQRRVVLCCAVLAPLAVSARRTADRFSRGYRF